jgi:hypothetical protein
MSTSGSRPRCHVKGGHRMRSGIVPGGHKLSQEAPQAFAKAVVGVDRY